MSYRVLLRDADDTIHAITDWVWNLEFGTWEWEVKAEPGPRDGLGFAELDDAKMAVDLVTMACEEHPHLGHRYRLFRIDEGTWPTKVDRADAAVRQREADAATYQPWRRGMRGPRGPLIPGDDEG